MLEVYLFQTQNILGMELCGRHIKRKHNIEHNPN